MHQDLYCPHCFAPFDAGAACCAVCNASVINENPVGALPFGAIISDAYVIGKFISVDGEGVFYHAVAKETDRPVCIKEYFPITLSEDRALDGSIYPKPSSGVLFKTTRMDFADLYRAIQNITPAMGLHAVLDVVEDNNTAYAVLAHLDGMPLSAYLKQQGNNAMTPEKAHRILARVFEGAATMHAAGLVHRGISPDNIMVLPDGRTCLTGYATIGLRTIGTVLRPQLYEGYSAPEQYDTAAFEGRYTDVYCLAAVYYSLVAGEAPVSAGQRLVVDSNPSVRSLNPNVPRYLSDFLVLALRMNPAERLQSVSQMDECLASQEEAQELLNKVKRAQRKKSGFSGPFGIALIIIAVMLCLVAWFAVNHSNTVEEEPVATVEPTATPEPTPVPVYVDDFVGLSYEQLVSTTVYNDKYLFYITEEVYSEQEAGTVLSQKPAAGQSLGDDVTIELVVSKGPEMVQLPNVFGFTQDSAEAELNAISLSASFVMEVNDGSYASGCVIKTDPEAGTQVQTGTVVTVYIAAERDVQVVTTPQPTATPDASETSEDENTEE